jgi:Holliday junction resolvase RusA-like endonuclease
MEKKMISIVKIKPLSVNDAWQGKRFKSPAYKKYENDVLLMLPTIKIPISPLSIAYEVGYSNPASDIDNFVKPFQDILCKKYKFDDRDIYRISIIKKIVPKSKEYIKFGIEHLDI